MTRFGHDRLPTFGVGADLDKRGWQSVFRQLVAGGYLAVDVDGHGGLSLGGGAAAEVLRGERQVELRRDPAPVRGGRKRGGGRKSSAAAELERSEDRELFEVLRAKRLELARAASVAPFMVFPDRTLLEMATRRPDSLVALGALHGVGQVKLDRWGAEFLAVLGEHRA
jgi:ATP-dependent DNA helicase RecQ